MQMPARTNRSFTGPSGREGGTNEATNQEKTTQISTTTRFGTTLNKSVEVTSPDLLVAQIERCR